MLKRTLLAGALAAAVGAPAAHAQSPSTPGNPSGRPPVRLWYRLSLTADITKAGDFAWAAYTDHRVSHVKLRLRSRTAVLLYRQCTALALDSFDPRVAARLLDPLRQAVNCAQVRADLRGAGWTRARIRQARLVEDVRFQANGEGFADQFDQRIDLPPRETIIGGGNPEPVDCPAQSGAITRTTGPEPIGGALETISAAREGVGTRIDFPRILVHDALVGGEGGPCHVRSTGAETLVPRLTGGFHGAVFDPTPGYGPTPTPSILRFRIGQRFGSTFTIESREDVREPLANGTWVTSGPVALTFELCAHGGRRARGC